MVGEQHHRQRTRRTCGIHESFGAYAGILVRSSHLNWGHEEALNYINGKRRSVRNDRPIIGEYGLNREGSGDMYDKGQLVLNTLRTVINDDDKWFAIHARPPGKVPRSRPSPPTTSSATSTKNRGRT